MRARTILGLCCFVVLLLTGAVLSAEPLAPAAPFMTASPAPAAAPECPAPAFQIEGGEIGGGPETNAACPAAVWQQCYQRHGTCALCFCIGAACECENRCM